MYTSMKTNEKASLFETLFLYNKKISFEKLILFSIYCFPFTLITGSFLPDLTLSISALYFIYVSIKFKLINYYQNIYIYLLSFFYFFILFRSFFAVDILLSLEHSLFFFRYIFFILAVIYFIKKHSYFTKYLTISLASAITIIIIDAYIQLIFQTNLLGMSNQGNHFLNGMFGSKEVLGFYVSRLTPLLLGLIYLHKKEAKKYFFSILILLTNAYIITFISGDRSDFFVLTLSFILISFLIKDYLKTKLIIFMGVFALFTFIIFNNSDYKFRYIDNVRDLIGINTDQMYFISWHHHAMAESSLNMFLDNPLAGQGTKMYRKLCSNDLFKVVLPGRDIDNDLGHSCSTHPHNWYLELSAETGIIGIILVFSTFVLLFYKLYRQFISITFLNKSILKDYEICFIVALFVQLLPIVPSLSFFNNWSSVIFYLILAFYLLSHIPKKNNL